MAKKYKRCKRCKELVIDVDNCANCEAKKRDGYAPIPDRVAAKRGSPTLDIQERNSEEYF